MKRTIIVLLLLFCCACAKHTTVRSNSGFDRHDLMQNEICIMPAETKVNVVSFGGSNERMHDYEDHLEQIIDEVLADTLQSLGYKARITSKRDLHLNKVSSLFLKLKEEYRHEMDLLYTKDVLMPEEKAFSIGNKIGIHASEFGSIGRPKYIMFSDYYAAHQSNGSRVAGVLCDVMFGTRISSNADVAKLFVGIVNNDTGDIAWANTYSFSNSALSSMFSSKSGNNKEIDRQHLSPIVKEVLKPLS